MAYKKSRAMKTFESDIKGYSEVLAKTDRQVTEPTIRQYVISAAVFLGHASFENFIRDLFDILGTSLSTAGVHSKKLPSELRMFLFSRSAHLEQHYASYQSSGDERRLLQSLSSLVKTPKRSLLHDNEQAPRILGSEILASKTYPSSENLERVFSRLGIQKIFDATSALIGADSSLLLKGFADKRTELAHNAVMPGTSAADIRVELEKLQRFVAALDRVSYNHITQLVGQPIWYAAAV